MILRAANDGLAGLYPRVWAGKMRLCLDFSAINPTRPARSYILGMLKKLTRSGRAASNMGRYVLMQASAAPIHVWLGRLRQQARVI